MFFICSVWAFIFSATHADPSEYPDIPALSRLAGWAPHSIKIANLFFREPLFFHIKQLVKICRGKNLFQAGIQVNDIDVGIFTAATLPQHQHMPSAELSTYSTSVISIIHFETDSKWSL